MPVRARGKFWQSDIYFRTTRLRFSFPDENAARAWEEAALRDIAEGREPTRPLANRRSPGPRLGLTTRPYTLGTLLEEVYELDWRYRKSAETLASSGRQVVAFFGERRDVRTMSKADVDGFIRSLAAKDLSGGTINRKTSALSRMFRQARESDHSIRTPKITRMREAEFRTRIYNAAEERRILGTLKRWGLKVEHDLVVFLFDTGARLGEALSLTWENVKVTTLTIGDRNRPVASKSGAFTPAALKVMNEADPRRTVVTEVTFVGTKTDQPRTLTLTKRAAKVLATRWRHADVRDRGPFAPVRRRSFHHHWVRVRDHLELGDEALIHTIRHTNISRLAASGIDVFRLQKWAGHKAIVTTQRYVKLAPRDLDALTAILNAQSDDDDD
jgi:integrase